MPLKLTYALDLVVALKANKPLTVKKPHSSRQRLRQVCVAGYGTHSTGHKFLMAT
jgi:hypothetical protein